MRTSQHAFIGTLGLLAIAASLGACSAGGDSTGAAGTSAAGTSAAGTTAATAGTNGNAGTSAAGTTAVGGTNGTAGTTAAAGTGGGAVKSVGCGMAPATADSQTNFIKKEIMVTGVDQAFIAMYPVNNGSQYNWTKRNFYVRLPKNYSPDQAYSVDMAGTGCAGSETSGSAGEYTLPTGSGQTEAIQIGLSYVTSSAANPSCVAFTDDYVNSPEPMYINAVIDEVAAKYCVDKNKIFINGYSSGAFESVMAGGANADKLRAIGIQIGGGLRIKHAPIMNKPVAAIFVVGTADTGNPIGPLAAPQNDSLGSALARDELLKRNGCVAQDFALTTTDAMKFGNAPKEAWDAAYPKCMKYSGCPAKYPVVWCPLDVNHGNGPNPMGTDGGTVLEGYRRAGIWKFFQSLPAP